MNGFICWIYLFLVLSSSAQVKLFNTEDSPVAQSYDCIYYTNVTSGNNETTPYCIRTNESVSLVRNHTCEDSGKEWTFRNLKKMKVSEDVVLTWSSSIEMTDRYAAYLTTGNEDFANDKVCNCSSKTFGKFCEYEFMRKISFEDTIQYQFYLKTKYRNGSQLWGNITCYTTLTNCYFGLRCLTWHNICDGKQQCTDGIDEDYCEQLEFNECEENEYRCEDGSCISDRYWLDGQYDCLDKSDEQTIMQNFTDTVYFCPLTSSQFSCDEVTSRGREFACGDGQFAYAIPNLSSPACYNLRSLMFFCEYYPFSYEKIPRWTLKNGHCVEKGRIETNLTEMDELEKCVIYLKCLLVKSMSADCDDVLRRFQSLCENKLITYPSEPVLKPYVYTVYDLWELHFSSMPNYLYFNGSIKCIGYQAYWENSEYIVFENPEMEHTWDVLSCDYSPIRPKFGAQFDKNCWNDSRESFGCHSVHRCISKYRVRNGINDCYSKEDEDEGNKCYMKKRDRLKCSKKSPPCLLVTEVGDTYPYCDGATDEYIESLKWIFSDHQCRTPDSLECNVLKTYIRSSSPVLTIENNKVLTFRQYCDTTWHLSMGFDESSCKNWKCSRDEYQCMSGHCIPLAFVLDNEATTWHCPDATDSIGLFGILQHREHNIRFLGDARLQAIKGTLYWKAFIPTSRPFQSICLYASEYSCILANVTDPLNFTANRPCINVTQIGDGIIDCYGGLDERNLLACGNNTSQQRGFDFPCDNQQCIPYHRHCQATCLNNEDNLLCDQLPILWESSCIYNSPTREQFCTERGNVCDTLGLQPYYCDIDREDLTERAVPYRMKSWKVRRISIDLPEYPRSKEMFISDYFQSLQNDTINNHSNISETQENDGEEGWICGRGIATKSSAGNKVQCFCPPSLYGEYCQYFSDRITLIISLNNIPSYLLEQQSSIIKVVALFLLNNTVIDDYVFHLPLILSKTLQKKFRFTLIHPRPRLLSNSYAVRFEAYHLTIDSSIRFLAAWEYPISLPFLPSFRLAQVLSFDKQVTLIQAAHICKLANPCLNESTCYPLMNKINDTSAYYCYCKIHSFGKNCQHFQQPTSPSQCSKHSLIRRFSSSKSICLCPNHLYGPTCHLKHSCVNKKPCGINRGQCYANPDNVTHDYICICDKKYFGDSCEFHSAILRINLTDLSFVQTSSNIILSSIIQLCDFHNETLHLLVREKRVYQGLPPAIIEISRNDYHLPEVGIMKFYHKYDLSNDYIANLQQADYFILYITSANVLRMNITLEINRTNYCPYTPIVFQKNISKVSSLSDFLYSNERDSKSQFNATTILFEYHLLCDEPYSLLCFQDDNYFCVCDEYLHAECSRYESKLDECHGQCRAGGQCIRGDLDDRRDFVCLCPRCYYGSVCQHNTELFSFTLETLLANDLNSPSLIIQRLSFSLLIIVPVILLLIGIVSNVFCYVTFNRSKPLIVGAGHYLRTVSIINQLTLVILMFKLIHLVLSIKGYIVHQIVNTVLCKGLSYFLSCTSRMSYWLMGMVAIERVYVTWYLRGTWLKRPRIAKRIIAIVILGIMVFNIHEMIYYQSIEDPKSVDMSNRKWCVTSYPSVIATYNQVNIILNYVLPVLINLLSTITLIILLTRKRATATVKQVDHSRSIEMKRSRFRVYTDLLIENRELILAPSVTMLPQLFSLPQFILSFSLACQEFNVSWQRYLLIASYFITYLPHMLSYTLYISPSKFYKTEFHATKLYKKMNACQKPLPSKQAKTTVSHTMNAT